MDQASEHVEHRARKRLRFSLRTLLIAVTLLSIMLGLYISRVQNERRAAEAVQNAHGELVYDWQIRPPGSDPNVQPVPPGPQWLRKYLGPPWLDRIVEVRLNGFINASPKNRFDLVGPHLAKLAALRSLQLSGEELSTDDYRLLGRFAHLEELSLRLTRPMEPDDAAGLAHAPRLREFHLSYAMIGPEAIRELAALPKLKVLQITCDSFDRKTGANVQQYQLRDDAAAALAQFSDLTTLMLFHTQITDKGVAALCRIERLDTLVISSPNITSASFDSVINLKRLNHLGTWAWKIDDADIKKLSQRKRPPNPYLPSLVG